MIGCIIQARMGSKRLPGKVMMQVDKQNPSIFYTLNQLKFCKKINEIVVATSTNKEDDILVDYLKKNKINIFRGKFDDVLDRYYQCAKEKQYDNIIRITADCPLIDPVIVDSVIDQFEKSKVDYTSNVHPRTFPDGYDVEVFSFTAIENAWKNATLPSEREHVTPYIWKNPEKFSKDNYQNNKNLSKLRLTLDYNDDLILIRKIIREINSRPITLNQILTLLTRMPELIKINDSHNSTEAYQRSLNDDEKFLKNG